MGFAQFILSICYLSQSEIAKLGVSICEDKYIFCLEISIEHILTMEVLQAKYNTGSDELDTSLSQGFKSLLARMRQEATNITPFCALHH